MNDNTELIMELWARIKSHVPVKERLEVADIIVTVFDEFGKVDDDLIEEDLDKELRAAVKSRIDESEDEQDEEDYDD